MLVGAFILAGCSKDENDYALANHTHTGRVPQTFVYYLNGITLQADGTNIASATTYELNGEISKNDAVLIYECTGTNQNQTVAYWTMLPYSVIGGFFTYQIGDTGILYLDGVKNSGTWTSDYQMGTLKVIVISHYVDITMKSKGININNYEEVAKYCNLPADEDITTLKVAKSE